MRTARALTVCPKEILEKKLETPWKIGDPPKNWRPPKNLETPPRKIGDPPVNRMTNWCKNITLPQTSFAGGNN